MVVVVLTFAVAGIMLLLELSERSLDVITARSIHIVVVLLWGLAALWLTFTGPFTMPGNGYFGLWVGLVCASQLVLDVQKRLQAVLATALANETYAAVWGQFIASLVVIIAVATLPSIVLPSTSRLWGYALAVGIVGAALSVLSALLIENPSGRKPLLYIPKVGILTFNGLVAVILLFWWGVGTGILTIHGPFTSTGNAYFALWVGFGCSLIGVGVTAARTKAVASSSVAPHGCLAICAFIVICTASPIIADDKNRTTKDRYGNQTIFALVSACVTIVMVFVAVYMQQQGKLRGDLPERVLAISHFVIWTVLASWCTFTGPFIETDNGYFASWGGVFSSATLILNAFPQLAAAAATSTAAAADQLIEEAGMPADVHHPHEPVITAQPLHAHVVPPPPVD